MGQQEVLEYIRENPGCTVEDMKEDLELSERALYRNLGSLQEGGFVEKNRPGRFEKATYRASRLYNNQRQHA